MQEDALHGSFQPMRVYIGTYRLHNLQRDPHSWEDPVRRVPAAEDTINQNLPVAQWSMRDFAFPRVATWASSALGTTSYKNPHTKGLVSEGQIQPPLLQGAANQACMRIPACIPGPSGTGNEEHIGDN